MKRIFDLSVAIILVALFIIPILIIALSIKITSKGKVLHWSKRIGKANVIFFMPKFRSMRINSPTMATHLMTNPNLFLSPIGGFLRRSSLDELPQLYSIIKGDMSLVGPRPALHNQDDLIAMRNEKEIDKLVPGITGWAQVNGRDNLSISEKVEFDEDYLHRKSFWFDLKILWMTFLKVINRENINH